MFAVRVEITKVISDDFPTFVECRLNDFAGQEWLFVEKLPLVTESADWAAQNPRQGLIGCEIVTTWVGGAGEEVVEIDTRRPWGIESVGSVHRFKIFAS